MTSMEVVGKRNPVYVTRLHDGSYQVEAMKHGQLVHRRYMGYTKVDATRRFRAELRRL